MNALTPLMPSDMDQAIRLAKAMSSAKMLPKHLQDDVGTCLMIVEQAMRWGMSPFAVAQCTSSIGGKLMFEGKLVAAAVEASGVIEGHFDYDYDGEGDDRRLTISARRKGEAKDRQLTIKLRDVRTSNEHWKKQPDQMLAYSGARSWARRYTPAVLLGVYAPEEFDKGGKPVDSFDGPTIDHEPEPEDAREAINAAVPMPAAAAATPRPPRRTEAAIASYTDAQWKAWLAKTSAAMDVLRSRQEVVEVGERESVKNAIEKGPDWLKRDLDELLHHHYTRFPDTDETPVDDDPFAPGLIVHGEEKVGAG